MTNHGCNVNGTIDDSSYSSFSPVIGLYVAAASSLCLVLMIYDIVAAKLAYKHWLPCKLFALNSVTLTLLSIASKIPVDLMTPMPSRQDQLSKLTGTTFICISMGFLAPSLGVNTEADCLTNMLALTIFVVTICVNICLQLSSGVISLFIPEHIIILGLMLLLLLLLWNISFFTKARKRIRTQECNNILMEDGVTVFRRLKVCCLYTYCINSQLEITRQPLNAAVSSVCGMCLVIVVQAGFRSVILKNVYFCDGNSVYTWSITPIWAIQIVTVVVGSSAVVFRWLKMFRFMDMKGHVSILNYQEDEMLKYLKMKKGVSLWTRLLSLLAYLNSKVVIMSRLLVLRRVQLAGTVDFFHYFPEQEFCRVTRELNSAGEYIVEKGVEDMIRLMKVNKTDFFNNLLTQTRDSSNILDAYDRYKGAHILESGIENNIKVYAVTMALLEKVAQLSMPENETLLQAFKESREMIYFIMKTMESKSSGSLTELTYAKILWTVGDLTCLVAGEDGKEHSIHWAIAILLKLRDQHSSAPWAKGAVWCELCYIIEFIHTQSLQSKEQLCRLIKDLFFDMADKLIDQLPDALFKSLNESSAEEIEERVRVCMKFVLQTGYFHEFKRHSDIIEIKNPTGPIAKILQVVPFRPLPEPTANLT